MLTTVSQREYRSKQGFSKSQGSQTNKRTKWWRRNRKLNANKSKYSSKKAIQTHIPCWPSFAQRLGEITDLTAKQRLKQRAASGAETEI
eukprot:649284-Pleurochrysis_carterae.AAC.1